jgi:glycosyltransferase involved in cell wall biosynthesis
MSRIVLAISHSEHAGAQLIWADLAVALSQRGHDVSLVALYPGRGRALPLQDGLCWTHCIETVPRSPLDPFRALRAATRHLRRLTPDIVFSALPAANAIFPVAAVLSGTAPKVFTAHHSPVFTYKPLYRLMDAAVGVTQAVSGVVCVSASVQSSLAHRPRRYLLKSLVIHNALPPEVETWVTALRNRRQTNHRPARAIIACGRLAEQKNYPVLIKAMAHVNNATLQIVGAGPEEASLQSLAARIGVAGRIAFLGVKPRAETLALLAESDVFVQPSLFEGHSLALVEAAGIGVPMIVSNVPSQIEAVRRSDGVLCALTHDPYDERDLAEALNLLLDDQDLRKQFQSRAASLAEETSFSRMVDAYEGLLG